MTAPPCCLRRTLIVTWLALAGGCARSEFDRGWVAGSLAERAPGAVVGPQALARAAALPTGVSLADGLSADEAVSVALWNSPVFQADLAQISAALADLAEAGSLPNPMLTTLFPLGPHQLGGYLLLPLAALVQRPARVKAARRDLERVAHSLVASGLDLIRDVRLLHTEALAAGERVVAREQLLALWTASEGLAQARADAGDVSRSEFDAIHGEALLAADLVARARLDAEVARLRLRLLLGVASEALPDATPIAGSPEPDPPQGIAALVREALAARPDLRAAELAVEAAGARLGLERARIFQALLRLDDQLDAQGFHPSIGFHQIELPVFNGNPGGRGRAKAELQRSLWRYAALRQQIVAEVATAALQVRQASDSLARWRGDLLQTLERGVAAATSSFKEGSESYVGVLDATRRLQDARLREIELRADRRRAFAQLGRSVGRQLVDTAGGT